ncbi:MULTISPECIES: DUF1120 domain-containing protein [unclassified Pseudomonas]|uniref:DUF1120 domain-containing protein n=1 Tax=unclassified Pseudomonas TaxID=196821 RepID=UPI0015A0408F|nr:MULTISPECIES: DUF1120 domain-containing protein [unclassified Pseudomonas]NWC94505.1 DUF1120 domain-containing protein [Pseudomonas sp. IPO3779]NWD15264.1 DUF1120 domain-containing protein [Pseudomonas sp. IPO3778]
MNRDKPLQRLTAILLLGIASSAQAMDECQLNLSESLLDFGQLSRTARHNPAGQHLVGERRLSLTLNCPQPTDLSLFYRGLAAGAERLRFTERGTYQIQLSDAVVDGQAVELGLLSAPGQAPTDTRAALNWLPGYGIAPVRAGAVVPGKSLALQLTISAWADAGATLVQDATTWEASGLIDAINTGRARELSLRARVVPAACVPTLSNGGLVSYGRLSAKELNVDKETWLATKTLLFSVACDAATAFAVRMQDNRNGSATGGTDETAYGLDLDGAGNKIGRFYVLADPANFSADTLATLYRTDSTTAGRAWSNASAQTIPLGANSYLGFTDRAGDNGGPVSIQNLSGSLHIRAVLAPSQTLDLRNVVQLNGSGTIEIIYL